jgi:hypothetical protein
MSEINYGAIATEWNRGGARRALAELKRQGYVIVPLEPTDAMVDAGEALDRDAAPYSGYATEYARCETHYAAMLAAAPKVVE